jgi:multisubunit Na+/H+ antiporter MnhB subunit
LKACSAPFCGRQKMETNRLPEGSDRAELLASNESSGSNQRMTEARISATERSGSITALGVLLGFSIAILSEWSNRPGKWELVGAIPLFLYGGSVALQVVALYRALQVPREIQSDHRRTIKLAVIGLVVMFVGFLSTIVIDVLGEAPVNTPTAISRH